MRKPLDRELRKQLENTVVKARDIAETATLEALQRLGVATSQAPSYLSEAERKLRNELRAHARQLGDTLQDGNQQVERLSHEIAYSHWHRMLFARFLEQNNLLMYDQYTPVTLEECAELAEEEPGCKDGWELAGRLAQKMLPQIFRADSPVFAIKFSINHINALEELIAKLDVSTYQAQDSLGWCYQFWQNKKKQQVNDSGVKIGAEELGPVTQLFTEPYMVSFLLDNALGAWWANKRLSQDDLIRANSEQELRDLAAIDGVPLEYLRFVKDEDTQQWAPAAGSFEQWPAHLSELTVLDPCCGSGHFLVAVFLMLVPLRMQLEGITEQAAIDAVLRDNIHGLELDQRCVELAAFALALEAWRYPNAGGYRVLPELNVACSGLSITEAEKEWKNLAKDNEALSLAVTWMQETFQNAPILGSLIDPTKNLSVNQRKGEQAPWERLQQAIRNKSDISNEAKSATQSLSKTAGLLSNKYCWVVTNPPYLGEKKQSSVLQNFIREYHTDGRADLATAFIIRIKSLLNDTGEQSLVVPQNWLYQRSYLDLRRKLLSERKISFINQLGGNAFEQLVGADVLLLNISNRESHKDYFFGLDLTQIESARKKSISSSSEAMNYINFSETLHHGDSRIVLSKRDLTVELLDTQANCYAGILNGDTPRFVGQFWEISGAFGLSWEFLQRSVSEQIHFGGRSTIILWENGGGQLRKLAIELKDRLHDADRRGNQVWGKKGIVISQMGSLPSTLYRGDLYDQSVGVIHPQKEEELLSIFTYCESKQYAHEVRKIDKKKNVTNATLVKIPFDLELWSKIAEEKYPNGLPEPYSDDPTQWIFHGHPCASVTWDEKNKITTIGKLRQDDTVLQVAVSRLLSYQWPAEMDAEMELAPEMREVMLKNADFKGLEDDDGIVCLPAVRGEKNAVSRLEAILHKAYGDAWSSSVEANLLKAVAAKDLESWLRDKFFEQHCKLFQSRPFIWQIWDGLKDGFSVLVNYHRLDYSGLERLIYTYLDDWISTQKRDLAENKDGADIRLISAENLKKQLQAILEGESGLDIFVRWKPLAEQPIGWNPDLNDGVRLNIRPFMLSKDVGKKGAGILRAKPNVHWKKDRGTDVASAPWFTLGLEYDGKLGDRINEHHLSLAAKRAARDKPNE